MKKRKSKLNKTIYNFETSIGTKPTRSIFGMMPDHKTTQNTGDLIPIFIKEILPGDKFKLSVRSLIWQTTLIKPIIDNLYIDIAAWFVPKRLQWERWQEFMGENKKSYWAVKETLTIPQIKAPKGGWAEQSIADYIGITPGIENIEISKLRFNAVALTYNEWYRDQNLQEPAHIDTEMQGTATGSNGTNYITDLELGGMPPKAGKYRDYFTSALPSPQKGEPITINIGGQAEVHAKKEKYKIEGDQHATFEGVIAVENKQVVTGLDGTSAYLRQGAEIAAGAATGGFIPNNLYADLSKASGISINELRKAITAQQILELDARGGTRYTEILKSHFGVTSSDARLQRPEFLGGIHQPLNIIQIPQTNESTDKSPQGNMAGYGRTGFEKYLFNKGFTEHGDIVILATIRYQHTYQQGIHPELTRKERLDFYDPLLANIGEQPIYNREIYATGTTKDNEIFGYKEAWAEYRTEPSRTSGKMRSTAKNSLDIWHLGDHFEKQPILSNDFIKEAQENVDRTLAIKSTGENGEPQFIADYTFEIEAERPMPIYSTPGVYKI